MPLARRNGRSPTGVLGRWVPVQKRIQRAAGEAGGKEVAELDAGVADGDGQRRSPLSDPADAA